jgi:hypothetical protein
MKFEERIRRKELDIQELEMQIREARSYMRGLQEALKILPRESADRGTEGGEDVLRPGTMVAAARGALQQFGRPLHLLDILTAIGKEPNGANRASLGGSLSAYVRKAQIFTRPGPNTFGLVEFLPARTEIPSGFGRRNEPSKDEDDEIPF